MSFDEEPEDVHGECRAEIHRLTAELTEWKDGHTRTDLLLSQVIAERDRLSARVAELEATVVRSEVKRDTPEHG